MRLNKVGDLVFSIEILGEHPVQYRQNVLVYWYDENNRPKSFPRRFLTSHIVLHKGFFTITQHFTIVCA